MRFIPVIILALLLGTCSEQPNRLAQVKQAGVLRVATRNSATTYYQGPHGPTGLEYDLAKRFAESLGVKLQLVVPDRFEDVLRDVIYGDADFAAAGLSITEARRANLRFSPPYETVTQQLVYRYGDTPPTGPEDLIGKKLVVVAGSSFVESLEKLRERYPALEWTEDPNAEASDLLAKVANGEIDYTAADSTEVALNQLYYPELRVGFDLHDSEPVAWAFLRREDDSLYEAAVAFIERMRESGYLAQLNDRYFGHTDQFDYVGTRIFMRDIESKLPAYRAMFQKAAKANNFDWRLLAAVGYQESHWNPEAISPTGVRGIMMLTRSTASAVGVSNRINPYNSITGGAEYLRRVVEKIPERIPQPDRTWMALAAYNVGFGHLEDARVLTEEDGGNPDRWINVRKHLPWLTQRKYFKQTEHGYARGLEPVLYVENIRRYYAILVFASSSDDGAMLAKGDEKNTDQKPAKPTP